MMTAGQRSGRGRQYEAVTVAGYLGRLARIGLVISVFLIAGLPLHAAPSAALVMDARSGEVLHAENADTRLHPASLTKMMTLYIVFEAIEHGEISEDTKVQISRNAASEPPSKLGMKPGQRIALRYLIRAAAVKSANDAATALAEAVGGSEAAFVDRMNRTAKALGMTRTTFRNANGLTASGHLSTARDMATMGRRLFYDHPAYYNLFSRISTDAGGRTVYNTNRKFLKSYRGADGIKTGFTNAAGFNLVASAERGSERIIAVVLGGRSTAARNARMAELLDMGFNRAPTRVAIQKPPPPAYDGIPAGKTLRLARAVTRSPRPVARPVAEVAETVVAGMQGAISDTLSLISTEADAAGSLLPAPAQPLADMAPAVAEALDLVAEDLVDEAPAPAPAVASAPATAETPGAPATVADAIASVAAGALELAAVEPTALVEPTAPVAPIAVAAAPTGRAADAPEPRPQVILAAAEAVGDVEEMPVDSVDEAVAAEIVTRMSTGGGGHWAISVGRFGSRHQAEKVLLETALLELGTLDQALRKVVPRPGGFEANFVGLSEDQAALACRRLSARNLDCATLGPG